VSCGEAYNITQRNADYYIDFGREGGRHRENVGKNKSTAEIILAKIKSEKAENRHLDIKKEHKIKFDVFADEYIELYAKNNNVAWKRSIVPNMNALKRFFTGKLLTEIDPHLIEKFKVERIKEVSPAATNRALTLLKSMFNRATEWDKFDGANPVTKVKFFREDNHKLRYLDKDEIKRLVENCEDMLRPLIIVAVNTGLRKAELFNLKWQDIDINNGTIHLLRTKNGEKREIPMNEAVKTVIVEAKEHSDSEYVFCTKTGNPYTDIRKPFARSLKRAGIKDCLWHTLRHTFASQLAMAGVDLNTIRELLGHSSTRMTIRYAHLSSNHKNNAVDLLNECLDPTTNTHCDTYVTHDVIENNHSNAEENPTCLISTS
jgi:integrase